VEATVDISHIDEEIASRTLEWTDHFGSRPVTVRMGKASFLPDSGDMYCPFQIVGIGSGRVKYAVGVDGFQAIALALRMIRADLEALQRELSGSWAWPGGGSDDLGF
jgi:hypothetical protein